MGGAASKDFLDGGPKNAVAKELDELGGYDRPALAKNQSFTARLDWLGTQVGKTSEQMEAALSKDEQAGRKELEKEAKRRQLMALRRGQGDIQMNLQYVDFYLRQKQFEGRGANRSMSILRNSHVASLAAEAVEASEASSVKLDASRIRTSEQVATLQRLYSTKSGPGGPPSPGPTKPEGPAPAGGADPGAAGGTIKAVAAGGGGGGGGNSKWRQTVAHAKKTAFLAVNTYMAMNNGKRRADAGRIDNFGLFAEQQLGEGVHKFVEEGERLASARDKLPDMKAELENLRSAMRQLAVEQQAIEASCPAEDGDGEGEGTGTGSEAEAALGEDDGGVDADEAAVLAASAAAAMRHPRQKASTPGKPGWRYGGTANGFDSLSSFPRTAKPLTRLRDAPASAPPGGATTSAAGSHSAPLPMATAGGAAAAAGGGSGPAFTTAGSLGAAQGAALTLARRRLLTTGGSHPAAIHSAPSNGSLTVNPPSAPPLARVSSNGAGCGGSPPLGGPLLSPGLPTTATTTNGFGTGRASGRMSQTRASWSGAMSHQEPSGSLAGGGSGGAAGESLMSMAAGPLHAAALRPLRPSAPGALRTSMPGAVTAAGVGPRGCRGENGAGGGGGPMRPASPARAALLGGGPRPPSSGGSPVAAAGGRPGVQRTSDWQRVLAAEGALSPATPGEHRVGTMALRIASKITLPLRAAKHQLRSLRDAETANVLRQQQLLAAIDDNAAVLQSSSGLLNMYCNRANGRWVEQQQWAMPPIHEAALPAVRQQANRYKDVVLKDLKEGRLAVQIHVDDDVFVSARLGALAMWSVDPWQLLGLTHPVRAEWTSHLVGLGMGVRQLLALATAVEAAAGAEALGRLQVVLSCHEGQVEAVVRDLTARRMCRLNPDNVIISVQQRAPGHTYDKSKHGFVPCPQAPPRAAGSGYALLSLCWAGSEAFRLGGPDLTERRPLERSALDTFLDKGVNWLSSWRLRDLVHYSPDTCLNLEQLALSYALADSMDANMSMQVELIESLHGISRYGSGIVLALKDRPTPAATPPPQPAPSATVPLLRRNGRSAAAPAAAPAPASAPTSADRPQSASPAAAAAQPPSTPQPQPPSVPQPTTPPRPLHVPPMRHHVSAPPSPAPPLTGGPKPASPRASLDSNGAGGGGGGGGSGGGSRNGSRRTITTSGSVRAGGIGSEGGPLAVCDVKWGDVQTPALATGLQQLLDAAAAQTGTPPRLAVSIKRYLYHVPSLKTILTGPGIFRPSVSVGEGGYLYVTFDASDITAQPAARCVALSYSSRPAGGGGAAAEGGAEGAASGAAAPPARVSSAGGGGGAAGASSNNAIALAAAQAAAAALQRGRLLTNDSDLDTLLWVMGEQDNHPAFRASVSATNTAKSRVTSHAAGGVAGASGSVGPSRMAALQQQRVIVAAVTDDAACPLAVRMAMAIMKPGADCLHLLTIAKDPSAMAVAAARVVAERFESMASATLGDVKAVVQVKRQSIVEDIAAYADSVRAVLLVVGSMSLAAAPGSSVVGSVALSLARDCGRPILVVKPTARLAETAYEVGKKPCLRAAVAAETGSRPMVRFVVDHVLEGSRGDRLVLIRGKAFDKDMQELTSSRRILDHLAEEAASNRRFDSANVVRRSVPGSFETEHQRVADADQCHILAVQVPECRGPLPTTVTQMLRTSRTAVLVYRTFQGRATPAATAIDRPGSSVESSGLEPEEQSSP
ncbi:hypothetical protein PLESTM_002005400 [Pleodorina starrii]|nr:hypothetical protein PLESTM_002005400 [Pleodorina starrii]